MIKLLFTLTAVLVFTTGRGQSFEGIFKYDVSSDSPGDFSWGIEHYGTLKIKNGNIYTTLTSKREGQLEKLYIADHKQSYQIDHIKQRYVIMPRPPEELTEMKVRPTTDTKKILGHKCFKYVNEENKGESFIFWVAKDLADIDCKTIAEDLSFVPCNQIEGIPLMIDAKAPNGSYNLKVIEITPKKLPDAIFVLDKEYEIKKIR